MEIYFCTIKVTSKKEIKHVSYSQFKVTEFPPHAVYAPDKASSAVSLTAAVVKEEQSFDIVIKSGVLMLLGNGVYCINESDEMI